jgi:acyl-CoA synthetase (AMP-forming)/AMP-acid ligase II
LHRGSAKIIEENICVIDFIRKFEHVADKYPEHVAVSVDGTDRLTYRELYDSACRLASVLRSKGIKKSDIVALSMGEKSVS